MKAENNHDKLIHITYKIIN